VIKNSSDDAFPKVDFGAAIAAGKNPIADITGPIWLEIGFGGAEHLLWQAEQNPDVTLLGVEPFLNGVVKAVSGITQNDFKNIRLHRGDARDVLKLLPNASLERVFVLFINMEFLEDLHRVIKPGGTFRFALAVTLYIMSIGH